MTRVALISDIHFGLLSRTAEFSVPGEPIKDETEGGESLKNSMVTLLKDKGIEYLFVSGDLTSRGSPQEFSYCERLLLEIAEELGLSKERIILCMGNHDIDWNIANLFDTKKEYQNEFPKELVQEKYKRIAASVPVFNMDTIQTPENGCDAPFSGIYENDQFVVFVLNTGWLCTKDQAIRHGKLKKEQLDWLEAQAEEYKDTKKWKIVMMHHHPFNYRYPKISEDYSTLEEGSELLELIGKCGFNLVIHGHRHHPRAETHFRSGWKNPITFICAGSFAVNSEHRGYGQIPNTLHILELTEEIGTLHFSSYEYSLPMGWIPLKNNCPETPLDSEMLMGKLFEASEIETAIKGLASKEKVIEWTELDECLRFMPYTELNANIESMLSSTHDIIGKFPDKVILLEKRGGV